MDHITKAWLYMFFLSYLIGVSDFLSAEVQDLPYLDSATELKILKRPDIAKLIINRTYNRPSKCPLKVYKNSDLYKKLQLISKTLKYGECRDRNIMMINSLDNVLSESGDLYDVFKKNNANGGIGAQNNSSNLADRIFDDDKRAQIISTLEKVSTDESCLGNLQKGGLLPVVGEIATNIGQMATLVPSPSGFLISATGLGFGSTLKVLRNLFAVPFNWDQPNERQQFVDLNCSFFDMRRDIEAAEILEPRDEQIDHKIKLNQAGFERINKQLQHVVKKRALFLKAATIFQEEYVKDELGSDYDLNQKVSALTKNLSSMNQVTSASQTVIIKILTEAAPLILPLLEQSQLNPWYKPYLIEQLSNFTNVGMPQLNHIDTKVFFKEHMNPIKLYLEDLSSTLNKNKSDATMRYLNTQGSKGIKNQQYLQESFKIYDAVEDKLEKALKQIATRVQILKNKDRKKSFDSYDEGAHGTYDILQQYKKIQGILFGKTGRNYLEYYRKDLKYNRLKFIKGMRRFNKKYVLLKPTTEEELIWGCRDAAELRTIWERANSSAEVAYDFISTNSGIFHTNFKRFETFMYFPIGFSNQRKLYFQVRSAEKVVRGINSGNPPIKKDLNKFGITRKNLGKLMLDIKQRERSRLEIESFISEYDCLNYL